MVRKTVLAALCLGLGLAHGDALKADPPSRPKPKVIDLDFTGDDETWTSDAKISPDRDAPGRWLYWTLGAGAVAAGGLGWYVFRDEREPAIIRNEQIFTDAR